VWGVVGRNGAGKSTLLRVVVGLLEPTAGTVRLMGRPLDRVSRRDRARKVAFLPQQPLSAPAATAGETVLMGRFPHRRYSLFETRQDLAAARAAMEATDTARFMDRSMATLSGGEAQRVHLAAALAQEPKLLVLDEPTAALDLYHQFGTFDLLRSRTDTTGMSVVLVTHDLNIAGRYCDRLLLLDEGKPAACGRREEVLRTDVLERVYRVRFAVHRNGGGQWVLPIERVEEPS
jgi:iron complex transport system ATP-binding protein